jgi:hypothetical protein
MALPAAEDPEVCAATRSDGTPPVTSGSETGTTETTTPSSSVQSAHRNGQGRGDRVGGVDLWLEVGDLWVEAAAGVRRPRRPYRVESATRHFKLIYKKKDKE